ncbi:MAG: phosphoglycerate kinase [Candidatus Levybacteria bacterium]|nr:phosphoglycerate kinase [Candidatus Levybacteria bacterium]
MVNLPSLESANVRNKRVFVRCDFDVPLSQQPTANKQPASPAGRQTTIADDMRLISGVSTIEHLLEQGATVIAAGHLGRPARHRYAQELAGEPGDQFQITEPQFSLLPIAQWFAEEFPGTSVKQTHIGGFSAWKLKENFYILENLRFYKEEEENDRAFYHKLAYLVDIYVNEAFGSSHRPHASIVGIPSLLPHFPGFHFQKEVKILSSVIDNPRRPFTFIVGGAKIETKLPLISRMHKFADYVLVGGELAEQDKVLIKEQHESMSSNKAMLFVADLNSDKTDITPKSLENFLQIVPRSKCIIWNGPMGLINEKLKIKNEKLEEGDGGYTSLKLAEEIIASGAYKVVGGGDTIGLLNKHKLLGNFDFASVGGGAMLEFLSGETLPGVLALQN